MATVSLLCGWGVKCESPCTSWHPCQHRSSNRLKTTIRCTKNWLWTLSKKKNGQFSRWHDFAAHLHRIWATKGKKSRECPTLRHNQELKRNFRGQSCLGSLSQVEALPGTSCRWCRSGGCKRTAEPARRLGCCPTASQSTSTRCLLLRHTARCNRCWSGERGVVGLFHLFIHCVLAEFFEVSPTTWQPNALDNAVQKRST